MQPNIVLTEGTMLGVRKSDKIGKFIVALWSHHHYKQTGLQPLLGILVSFRLLKSVWLFLPTDEKGVILNQDHMFFVITLLSQ